MKNSATPGAAETSGMAVTVRNLSKRYSQFKALDDVSFDVGQGEFFGVLGPNGAGKTTLLEILVGLRRASSGSVSLLGGNPWPRNRALLARTGMQTQAPAFFPNLTVSEHLETVAGLFGRTSKEAAESLVRFGLDEKAQSRVSQLSGGQRQRLQLASALCHEPEIVFLDEPTASLDPRGRRELWDLLVGLKEEGRCSIVYTTQQIEEAERLCDRVMILSRGTIRTIGRPVDLIKAQAAFQILIPRDYLRQEDAALLRGVDEAKVDGARLALSTSDPGSVFEALRGIVPTHAIQTRSATLEDAYLDSTDEEGAIPNE